MIFTHVFKKIETTISLNCISKALCFLKITPKHRDCPVFTLFLTKKVHPKVSRERSHRFDLNLTKMEVAIGGNGNCGLKNFQRAVSTGQERSTLNKTSFENQYVLDEKTRRRLAEFSLSYHFYLEERDIC